MKKFVVLGLILLVGCAAIGTIFLHLKPTSVQSETGTMLQNATAATDNVTEGASTQTSAGKTTSQAIDTQSLCKVVMAPGGKESGRRVMELAVKRLLRYIRRELGSNRMQWWLKCRQLTQKDFLNMLVGRLYQAVNTPVDESRPSGMVTQPPGPAVISSTQNSEQQTSSIPLGVSSNQSNTGKATPTSYLKFFRRP
ncbi:unnamed protein product [Dibothriocephalus latus]|uniref:Uncharacterized protein n=1 Tax=Dibothriocephalus latus TaxID=60516 RepID=A0A3P6PR03_DIBLA|nr:unnamed protein product [Dibothriocephalus latus]